MDVIPVRRGNRASVRRNVASVRSGVIVGGTKKPMETLGIVGDIRAPDHGTPETCYCNCEVQWMNGVITWKRLPHRHYYDNAP